MSNKYIPFLKLKGNEIAALKALSPELKSRLIPFFDIPKKNPITSDGLKSCILKAAKSVKKNLAGYSQIYLDDYDIDESIKIDDDHSYGYAIREFSEINFIPVVGLDRTPARNDLVFSAKISGLISSNRFAIRLQNDDFESFRLIQHEIREILSEGLKHYEFFDIIFDNRYCHKLDTTQRAEKIIRFISQMAGIISPERIVIAGSSIPASIGEIISTEDDLIHPRAEISIYRHVISSINHTNLCFGDYTVVSPLYSDLDIPAAALRNVITAKILYTFDDGHYISRGGALRSHVRGDLQYNDIAKNIVEAPFYRGATYSFGDNFLEEKSRFIGASVTASSILKPTINLHITYMLNKVIH